MSRLGYGACRHCDTLVTITRAGGLRRHRDALGADCPGSGTLPLSGSELTQRRNSPS